MTSVLSSRLARSMWRRNDSSWTARPSSPVRNESSPVSPTARTLSCAWASCSISARAASRSGSRGASLGCSATPATSASWVAAASTAHRAPRRSQPICTIRGTPTAAAAASASSTGRAASSPRPMSRWQWLSTTGCGSGSGAGGRSLTPTRADPGQHRVRDGLRRLGRDPVAHALEDPELVGAGDVLGAAVDRRPASPRCRRRSTAAWWAPRPCPARSRWWVNGIARYQFSAPGSAP